jgi:phage shock protein A
MSLTKRLRDISVATLNEMLESSEDPVRLIDKYLAAQAEQIRSSERLLSQCMAHAQSVRQQYLMAEQIKEKREQQAIIALKAGEDEIARLALQEKLQQEEMSAKYKALYEESKYAIAELEDQIRQLKADLDEVAAKRSYYVARLEAVRLQQRMNERLRGTSGRYGAARVFERLDESVADMELQARTLRDLRSNTREALHYAGKAVSQAIEMELADLRRKLQQEGWMKR